jgi:hypothetical protein
VARETEAQIRLTYDELALLVDALDSHEYWQLGDELPRNDGFVFVPGDFAGDEDRYWGDRVPTESEQEAITAIEFIRALAAHLGNAIREQTNLVTGSSPS